MKLAYIILAHKLPQQLIRLIDSLDEPESIFVLHLCKNTSRKDYYEIKYLLKNRPNIFYCKRERGAWGEFSLSQAVLNGMKLLSNENMAFDYISVLSGNDYPIKSNNYIKDYMRKNIGKQFLWYLPVYDYIPLSFKNTSIYGEGWDGYKHPWGSTHRFLRFEKYWYSLLGENLMAVPEERFLNQPARSVLKVFLFNALKYIRENKIKREFLLMILSLTHKKKRKMLDGYIPYAGSQWFSITKDCMEYILKQVRENKKLVDFFQHTLISDESFFTTIIVNSSYIENIAQNNCRYIKWPETGPHLHPVILTKSDFQSLKNSDKLFARKFDMTVDSEILDLIDKEILFSASEHHVA